MTVSIDEIVAGMKQGKVALLPSDTCYGFSCDATNENAVRKIFELKKRDISKPLSVLVASKDMAQSYVEWNEEIELLWNTYLPGPYTLVLPKKKNILLPFLSDTIGVRMPQYELLTDISKKLGKPIVTTSANVAGHDACYSVESVVMQIDRNSIDMILDIGEIPVRSPSTLVFWEAGAVRLKSRSV